MRDLMNNIHPITAIAPVSVADNTPQVSAIINLRGFDSLTFAIALGALSDADATFAATMHHGDAADLSDAALVPSNQIVGSLALAGFRFDDDNKTRKVGYCGNKSYVRLTVTPSNNASAALLAVMAILGHPSNAPTANPPM